MARYYASVTNGRGTVQNSGGRASIQSAHIRGWDVGVEIECLKLVNGDALDIFMTTGSNASGDRVKIGRVSILPDEFRPVFTPESE